MNNNAIKQIYAFNQKAGLLDQGYSDERECAFPIEEALEGFELDYLSDALKYNGEDTPKLISREIISLTNASEVKLKDVDRLDKHIDSIIFNFGSIFKLGLNVQEAMKALEIVATANMQKLNAGRDETGKQNKPIGFKGPEKELQKILNKINKG